jgi:hypothetical protein
MQFGFAFSHSAAQQSKISTKHVISKTIIHRNLHDSCAVGAG